MKRPLRWTRWLSTVGYLVTIVVCLVWPWTAPWCFMPLWAWQFFDLGRAFGFDEGAEFVHGMHRQMDDSILARVTQLRADAKKVPAEKETPN